MSPTDGAIVLGMPSSNPSIFGEISGFPPGSSFASRAEVRHAGLHRHNQAGISGAFEDGADAIIVSGGYVDDLDNGDWILYTGEGGREPNTGRQVRDQSFDVRGNRGLVRSEEQGLPVRVIRGWEGGTEHSPAVGYRYDGVFVVTRHWSEPSVDGPIICRFSLEAINGGDRFGGSLSDSDQAPPDGSDAPTRAVTVVQRIVRNTRIAQWVKDRHDSVCQICGIRLETHSGAYAEGAHVRPLGAPHNGPDQARNILCLCPNDHVLFDKGALYVRQGRVYRTLDNIEIGLLRILPDHTLDEDAFAYHRRRFAGTN